MECGDLTQTNNVAEQWETGSASEGTKYSCEYPKNIIIHFPLTGTMAEQWDMQLCELECGDLNNGG